MILSGSLLQLLIIWHQEGTMFTSYACQLVCKLTKVFEFSLRSINLSVHHLLLCETANAYIGVLVIESLLACFLISKRMLYSCLILDVHWLLWVIFLVLYMVQAVRKIGLFRSLGLILNKLLVCFAKKVCILKEKEKETLRPITIHRWTNEKEDSCLALGVGVAMPWATIRNRRHILKILSQWYITVVVFRILTILIWASTCFTSFWCMVGLCVIYIGYTKY